MEFRTHALQLPADYAGLRLDQALARALPQYSRARLQNWIESGAVQVDGRAPRAKDKVLGGEQVQIEAQLEPQAEVQAQELPLDVVHKDRALFVINKPAGLVVHPGAGDPGQTLQNALLALDPKLALVPRAGLVHRLDKDTSGLLVVARTVEAHAALVAALAARELGRHYFAICDGVMTGGRTVDEPIGRHRTQRIRMAVRSDGREAVTHFRLVQRFRAHTLVRAELETGRTHQIRVHLAHIGHPIVGDPVYGGRLRIPKGATTLANELRAMKRQALHAAHLKLTHPINGRELVWDVPMPEDMQQLIQALERDMKQAQALAESTPARARNHDCVRFAVPGLARTGQCEGCIYFANGGVSAAPYDSMNMGTHVGDDPAAVTENRARLRRQLLLPAEPAWLEQVHGADVVMLDSSLSPAKSYPRADAAVTHSATQVCVIQVADCMPVLFAARDGSVVGAAHAGWRGLASGVLEATVRTMAIEPRNLSAWMGPAIGATHFEVGGEVREAFMAHDPRAASAFTPNDRSRWQCDLYSLARLRLEAMGIASITGGGWCTFADASRFYSYRRDGRCGRMAALIWRT